MTTTMSSMRSVPWRHVKPMAKPIAYVPHVTTAHSIEETKTHSTRAVEKGVEVIDDLYGEALEIKNAGNTWLTYGPPMQLARVRLTYIANLEPFPLP